MQRKPPILPLKVGKLVRDASDAPRKDEPDPSQLRASQETPVDRDISLERGEIDSLTSGQGN